jgi:hypothetical protein
MPTEAILGLVSFVALVLLWVVLPSRLHHKNTEGTEG